MMRLDDEHVAEKPKKSVVHPLNLHKLSAGRKITVGSLHGVLGVQKTPWRSVAIAGGLGFCSAVQFSLYLSSIWPYLQQIDPDTTEQFYGAVVAAYSVGQIVSSPVLGYWSSHLRSVRLPVTFGLSCAFIGNWLYICAQLLPSHGRFFVLFARLIIGLSGGNIGVLKSYTSMASTQQERSRALACFTCGITVGSTLGPSLTLLFSPIGFPGVRLLGDLKLNMYTAPALSGCFMNALGLFFLWVLFVEAYAGLDPSQLHRKTKHQEEEQEEKERKENALPPFDRLAFFICCLTFFGHRFTFTNIETLLAPMGSTFFYWNKEEVVRYVGLPHIFTSIFALGLYLSFIFFKLDRFINLRHQCVGGLIGLIAFHFVTFSWPFLPELESAQANGTELLGCNTDRFTWCDSVAPQNIYVFYGAYVLFFGFCFPSINLTLNTLFSKIMGPRRMSTQQGILQMSGSAARLVGPMMISQLYVSFGPRASWLLEIVVLGAIVATWLIFYRRMVPLKLPQQSVKSEVSSVDEDGKLEQVDSPDSDRKRTTNGI